MTIGRRREHETRWKRLPWQLGLAAASLAFGVVGFCETLPGPYQVGVFSPITRLVEPRATHAQTEGSQDADSAVGPTIQLFAAAAPTQLAVVESQVLDVAPPSSVAASEAPPPSADSGPTTEESPNLPPAATPPPAVDVPVAVPPIVAPTYAVTTEAVIAARTSSPSEQVTPPSPPAATPPPTQRQVPPTPTVNSGPGKSVAAPGHNKGADGKPTKKK